VISFDRSTEDLDAATATRFERAGVTAPRIIRRLFILAAATVLAGCGAAGRAVREGYVTTDDGVRLPVPPAARILPEAGGAAVPGMRRPTPEPAQSPLRGEWVGGTDALGGWRFTQARFAPDGRSGSIDV
jgi:hypothetical protein